MNTDIKLRIENYSNYISTNELLECLKLLPEKYTKLNNKVFIFRSFYQYLLYCLTHFMIISLCSGILKLIISLVTKQPLVGNYTVYNKHIYLYEDYLTKYIDYRLDNLSFVQNYDLYKKDLTKINLDSYKSGWLKFILLDSIIHELNHALQHFEKRLSNPFKLIFTKWENTPDEIDAIRLSISIFEENQEEFLQILNTTGIEVNHSHTPKINIRYKYNIKIP